MYYEVSVVSDTWGAYGLLPTRLLCLWDSLGKNTGMGCHALLQGIFPIQGSNPLLLYLLHHRQILYPQILFNDLQKCKSIVSS